MIPAEFSPIPTETGVLEITHHKGTLPDKKEQKKDERFNTNFIMTTYFEIQQDAAWSVQENDK